MSRERLIKCRNRYQKRRAAETQEEKLREASLRQRKHSRPAEQNILSSEDQCETPNSRL